MQMFVKLFGDFLRNDFSLSKFESQHKAMSILIRLLQIHLIPTDRSTSKSLFRFSSDTVHPWL